MDFVEGPIALGEWMPDLHDLKFPNLANAKYLEPVGVVYKTFEPLITTGGPAMPGALYPRGLGLAIGDSGPVYYVGGDRIYRSQSGGAFSAMSSTLLSAQYDFLQYDDLEIVALSSHNNAVYHTIGSASNFATLGSATGQAPGAARIGRINQFVFLGDLASVTAGNSVMWSGIDQPLSWPTPNSATAIAQQSGEQYLDSRFGEVTGFANGDQFGLIFQKSAITRVNYVGPPVVFQFDKISEQIGCPYPRSIVQVGGMTYFIAANGIHRTNGVEVENIGMDRVNNFFVNAHGSSAKERVYGAHNRYRNLIYWTFCDTSDVDSTPSGLIIYNHVSNRFTWAAQICNGIYSTYGGEGYAARNISGFGAGFTLGACQSTANSVPSSIETGDIEFTPGGFTRLDGAKLIVDATAGAIVGYSKIRNEILSNQLTSSAASTTNSATGFADFRREARYHRMLWEVAGTFTQAQAMEFRAKPSGSR
jgi:hypothetical protein